MTLHQLSTCMGSIALPLGSRVVRLASHSAGPCVNGPLSHTCSQTAGMKSCASSHSRPGHHFVVINAHPTRQTDLCPRDLCWSLHDMATQTLDTPPGPALRMTVSDSHVTYKTNKISHHRPFCSVTTVPHISPFTCVERPCTHCTASL